MMPSVYHAVRHSHRGGGETPPRERLMVVRNAVRASAQASSAVVLGGRWRSSGRAAQPRCSCTEPAVGRQCRRWHATGPMQRCYADKPFSATRSGSLAAGCAGSRPGRLPGWMAVGRWGGQVLGRQLSAGSCSGMQPLRGRCGRLGGQPVKQASGLGGCWALVGRLGGQLPVCSQSGTLPVRPAGRVGNFR